VTRAFETGPAAEGALMARFSEPSTTPVVVLVNVTVPVGFTPVLTPVKATENVTFWPGSTEARVLLSTPDRVAFVIVTERPVDLLGAKDASPAYLANKS
jgi:hypothetical protein